MEREIEGSHRASNLDKPKTQKYTLTRMDQIVNGNDL